MRSLDPTEDLAIQLVRRFLVLCEHPRTSERMLRLVERAPRAGEEAPRLLRWLNRALLMKRMRRGTRPMTTLKWELVASQLLALATGRYLVKLEPLASASIDEVVAVAAPGVLAVLQGPDEVFAALVADAPAEELEDGEGCDDELADLGDPADLDEIGEGDEAPASGGRRRWSSSSGRRSVVEQPEPGSAQSSI